MKEQSKNETTSTVESTAPADRTLSEKELDEVSGGARFVHDDESPKE